VSRGVSSPSHSRRTGHIDVVRNPSAGAAPTASSPTPSRGRLYTQLWLWVLVGITAGVVVGLAAPDVDSELEFLPDIFIQLIKMITAPVIFCTVIVGIASIGSLAAAGGIAARALAYFLLPADPA
jgi:aerobic C4-dicarboxylate transport protein